MLQELEHISSYLETVQEQIRWKRARPVLVQELERHLEDQRDDFIREGKSPEEAERLAIQDMGDPVVLGAELDRVHRPRPQWGLLGLTLALACAGAFLRVFITNGTAARSTPGNALLSLLLGTVLLLGGYFLDVSRIARNALVKYAAAVALAGMLTLVSLDGGIFRALYLSGMPHYISLCWPVFYAMLLYALRGKRWKGCILAVLGGIPLAFYCAYWISMASLLAFLTTGFLLLLAAVWDDWFGVGRRKGTGAALAAAASLSALVLLQYGESIFRRLTLVLHPELDPLGHGYFSLTLRSILDGVEWTQGSAVQPKGLFFFETQLLPALLAVRYGWLPLLVLLAALSLLLVWLLVRGLRQKHRLGRLVVLAVTLSLGVQLLLSTLLNLGFTLFAADLPLVVGNWNTVVNMGLIGLALSVFRGGSIAREEPVFSRRTRRRLRIRIEYQ